MRIWIRTDLKCWIRSRIKSTTLHKSNLCNKILFHRPTPHLGKVHQEWSVLGRLQPAAELGESIGVRLEHGGDAEARTLLCVECLQPFPGRRLLEGSTGFHD
jgi:hypothetical protein